MWAFFALENVSGGARSQLNAIICSDSQKKSGGTVNIAVLWIAHTQKGYSIKTVGSRISGVIFTSNEKKTIYRPQAHRQWGETLCLWKFLKSMWVFPSFSLSSLTKAWIKGSTFLLECETLSSLRFVLAKSFSEFHNWTQKI